MSDLDSKAMNRTLTAIGFMLLGIFIIFDPFAKPYGGPNRVGDVFQLLSGVFGIVIGLVFLWKRHEE
jgi:hypothetical protein